MEAEIGQPEAGKELERFSELVIRGRLIEPLAQSAIPADKWAFYEKEVQPYLAPFDAIVQATRKDGSVDHSTGALTVH